MATKILIVSDDIQSCKDILSRADILMDDGTIVEFKTHKDYLDSFERLTLNTRVCIDSLTKFIDVIPDIPIEPSWAELNKGKLSKKQRRK